MISAFSLWLPILLSAVLVFIASSVIHMMLSYHNKDFRAVPDEDGVMDALRGFDIPAGDYSLPHAESLEVMRSEEYQDKARRGPVTFMTVLPDGRLFSMRDQLIQWFVYSAVVSLFAAYVTGLWDRGPTTWRSSAWRRPLPSSATRSPTRRGRSGSRRTGEPRPATCSTGSSTLC